MVPLDSRLPTAVLAVVLLATSTAWAADATSVADLESEEHSPDQPGHADPGRGVLAGASLVTMGIGLGMLAAGDGLNKGEPTLQLMGMGTVGLLGAGIGLLTARLAPRGERLVADRITRPAARFTAVVGGSSTLDASSPWTLGLRLDPTLQIGAHVAVMPHLGVRMEAGTDRAVDPRPQLASPDAAREAGLPVALTSHRWGVSLGAEVALTLPELPGAERLGTLEVRWRPHWRLARRVLQGGTPARQLVEHSALLPFTVGLRWSVSRRQRFTFLLGPRIDHLAFSEPGDLRPHRGTPALGSFYAEASWHLDVPLSPMGGGSTTSTARFGVRYVHSKLDAQRLDFGAVVGFFGPLELTVDVRVRRRGAPVALQVTAGAVVGAGGGPFVELGIVPPAIDGRPRSSAQACSQAGNETRWEPRTASAAATRVPACS